MIYIKESQMPDSSIVPMNERIIGVKNTNNVEIREFVLPISFKRMDLADETFTFLLNIDPVNENEPSYTQHLEKSVVNDKVYLGWTITRSHTKDSGKLKATIQILNEIGDIVWESYKFEFVVIEGIDAIEHLEEFPQNILQQLVMQAGAYAQSAKVEADRAKAEVDKIIGLEADGTIDIEARLSESVNVTGVSVGNIDDGDILMKDMTFTDFVKKLLIKMIPPTYTKPTLSISTSESTIVESGTTINCAITPTFIQNDGGSIDTYSLSKNDATIYTSEVAQVYIVPSFSIGDETIKFAAKCLYKDGDIKNNNLNEPYPEGSIIAGEVKSNEVKFVGYRSLFFGSDDNGDVITSSVDIRALHGKILNPHEEDKFTINIPIGHRRVYIAYPATLRDLKYVFYVEQGNANYNDIFIANKTIIDVADASGNVNKIPYKVFSWIPAIPFASEITLNITI